MEYSDMKKGLKFNRKENTTDKQKIVIKFFNQLLKKIESLISVIIIAT